MNFHERQLMIFEAKLRPADKMVLTVLNSRVGDNGQAWPSLRTLAFESGMSRATAWRRIEHLKELGVVTTFHGQREDGSNSTLDFVIEWPRLKLLKRDRPAKARRIQNERGVALKMSAGCMQDDTGPALNSETGAALTGERAELFSKELNNWNSPNEHVDCESLWERLNDAWTEAGHADMKLTDARKKSLRSRLDEHGSDKVVGAWRWLLTSPHSRATYLRENHFFINTFLRPSNCTEYVELSQSESGWKGNGKHTIGAGQVYDPKAGKNDPNFGRM